MLKTQFKRTAIAIAVSAATVSSFSYADLETAYSWTNTNDNNRMTCATETDDDGWIWESWLPSNMGTSDSQRDKICELIYKNNDPRWIVKKDQSFRNTIDFRDKIENTSKDNLSILSIQYDDESTNDVFNSLDFNHDYASDEAPSDVIMVINVNEHKGSAYIKGLGGDDIISATRADDKIYGKYGDDTLDGHKGDDYISGHDGDDSLKGGEGNDTLVGGNGDDYLMLDEMDASTESLSGGPGDDYFMLGLLKGQEIGDVGITGGEGKDYITFSWGEADKVLVPGSGNSSGMGKWDAIEAVTMVGVSTAAASAGPAKAVVKTVAQQAFNVLRGELENQKGTYTEDEPEWAAYDYVKVSDFNPIEDTVMIPTYEEGKDQYTTVEYSENDNYIAATINIGSFEFLGLSIPTGYNSDGSVTGFGQQVQTELFELGASGELTDAQMEVMINNSYWPVTVNDENDEPAGFMYGRVPMSEDEDAYAGTTEGSNYVAGRDLPDVMILRGNGEDYAMGFDGDDAFIVRNGEAENRRYISGGYDYDTVYFDELEQSAANVAEDTVNDYSVSIDLRSFEYGHKTGVNTNVIYRYSEEESMGSMKDVYSESSADNTLLVLKSIENIGGTDNSDWIVGDADANTLYGNGGNDDLAGGAWNDTLHGGEGDDVMSGDDDTDTLYGDAGNDYLMGGNGPDKLYGGDGDDYLWGGTDMYRSENPEGTSYIKDDEENMLYGGEGDDFLHAGDNYDNATTNRLYGEGGDDILHADESNSGLVGGSGNNLIYVSYEDWEYGSSTVWARDFNSYYEDTDKLTKDTLINFDRFDTLMVEWDTAYDYSWETTYADADANGDAAILSVSLTVKNEDDTIVYQLSMSQSVTEGENAIDIDVSDYTEFDWTSVSSGGREYRRYRFNGFK